MGRGLSRTRPPRVSVTCLKTRESSSGQWSECLSLSLTHSHSLSLSLSLSHTLSLTHTLSLSHSHSHSLSRAHTHTHTLSLSLTHTLTLSLTHTSIMGNCDDDCSERGALWETDEDDDVLQAEGWSSSSELGSDSGSGALHRVRNTLLLLRLL